MPVPVPEFPWPDPVAGVLRSSAAAPPVDAYLLDRSDELHRADPSADFDSHADTRPGAYWTAPQIAISKHGPTHWLQTGWDTAAYWMHDGVWGAGNLTRGTYTGLNGSQYEQQIGVSNQMGPNGEVAARMAWKWPTGTTEVKSYPALLVGNKPGFFSDWTNPGGFLIRLLDGTDSQVYPSGKTPGSFFPLQLPIALAEVVLCLQAQRRPRAAAATCPMTSGCKSTPDQIRGFNAVSDHARNHDSADQLGRLRQPPDRAQSWLGTTMM